MPSLAASQLRLYGPVLVLIACIVSLLYLFEDSVPVLRDLKAFSAGTDTSKTYETALHHDPPPDTPPYGAVVIASQESTDLSWVPFVQYAWSMYPYDVNKPNNSDPRLRMPASKGHEAMVYLSFIIDNYDHLPWCAIFIHGHRDAWHQEGDILPLIQDLDLVTLARVGYTSLRCDWYPSCPAEMRPVHHDAVVWGPGVHRKSTEAAIAGNWKLLFPDDKLPTTLASPCCAQFAVTRQTIIRRPKSDYERLRHWLLDSLLQDDVSGRVLEKLWAYIFLGEPVHCPSPQECACKLFKRCGPQNWTELPEDITLPKGISWP